MTQKKNNDAIEQEELAVVKKQAAAEIISQSEFKRRVQEIHRCKTDINYFASNYVKIVSLKDGLVTLKPYPKQAELLNFIKDNKRPIVLASRQSGKTTTYCAFCLWLLCFHSHKSIMLAANKAVVAMEIMGRIKLAYEYLPSWLKPAILTYNKSEMSLATNSRIRAFATASDACRGFSANCVILDEFSHVTKNVADSFFSSVYPVVSTDPDSKVIIVSTPNGTTNNLYYDMWVEAQTTHENDTEGWKPFRMDWWDVPWRDEEWRKNQIASIGIKRFQVEFNNEFIASGSATLIPAATIEHQRRQISEKKANDTIRHIYVKSVTDPDMTWDVKIFKKFEYGRFYIAAADVAEGLDNDASCLLILDATELTKITVAASFVSANISIAEFAALSARILNAYGCPLFLAENNGMGAGYLSALADTYGYPNILRHNAESLGIHVSATNKAQACLWLRELMLSPEFTFELNDSLLVDELSVFSKTSRSRSSAYSAPKGMHDDMAMTLVWAVLLLQPELLSQSTTVINTAKTSLGLEIASSIAYPQIHYLSFFKNDKLPTLLLHMTDDIAADWYENAFNAGSISTSIANVESMFFVVGDMFEQTVMSESTFDTDDGPMW